MARRDAAHTPWRPILAMGIAAISSGCTPSATAYGEPQSAKVALELGMDPGASLALTSFSRDWRPPATVGDGPKLWSAMDRRPAPVVASTRVVNEPGLGWVGPADHRPVGVRIEAPSRGPAWWIESALESEGEWADRPTAVDGSCDAAFADLGRAEFEILARVEALLERADHALASVAESYVDALDASALKRGFGTCLADPRCRPRVHLGDGLRVVAVNPEGVRAEDVAPHYDAWGRDIAAVLDGIETPLWDAASRAAALAQLGADLTVLCEPRRRRTDAAALERARDRFAGIPELLALPLDGESGTWIPASRATHVPGQGAGRVLASWAPSPHATSTAIVAMGAALSDDLERGERCRRSGPGHPIAVVHIDASGQRGAPFLLNSEELWCP